MNYTDMKKGLDYIRTNTSEASRYESLAEEATELAHAAQKLARYLRGEQPLAMDFNPEKEKQHLLEEFTDTNLTFHTLYGLPYEEGDTFNRLDDVYESKLERWVDRIKEKLVNQE